MERRGVLGAVVPGRGLLAEPGGERGKVSLVPFASCCGGEFDGGQTVPVLAVSGELVGGEGPAVVGGAGAGGDLTGSVGSGGLSEKPASRTPFVVFVEGGAG